MDAAGSTGACDDAAAEYCNLICEEGPAMGHRDVFAPKKTADAMGRSRLGTLLLLLACGACGGDAARAGVAVRDSAGIAIVTSPDSLLRYATISDVPVADLSEDGVPEREFYRIAGALVFPDGGSVVANAGSQEVRVFGPDGSGPIVAGGGGEGPGEFQSMSGLYRLSGDSLAVPDARLLRVGVFDRRGTYARTVPFLPADALPTPESVCIRPQLKAMLAGGEQVYFGWTCFRRDPSGGFLPYEADLVFWEPGVDTVVVVDRVPVLEAYAPPGNDPSNTDVGFPPFMKVTSVAAGEGSAYLTTGATYEVRRYEGMSGLEAIFRLDRPARATSPEAQRAYRQSLPEGREVPTPFPETLPAFDRLLDDSGQRVWAREYQAPGEAQERWAVFESDGSFVGWVDAPARVALRAVADSFAVGVALDDLGVERPRVLKVQR